MKRIGPALVVVGALALGACAGDDATTGVDAVPPAASMCAPDVPDCVDTVVDPGQGDAFDSESARAQAQATVGLAEDELDPDVRIARRGDEQFALTEDYVLGRITVELDEDDAGVYRVTSATVELPDGPETFGA